MALYLMKNNKEFCLFAGINDIPWHRIVHVYGRATNYPKLFIALISKNKDNRNKAITELRKNIEHQSNIMLATPFTLIFLLRILAMEKKRLDADLNPILDVILISLEAVRFQLDFFKENTIEKDIKSLNELLSEQYLWKEYENEEQEEINWEEYNMDEDFYYSLFLNTIDVVKINISTIDALITNNCYREKARKIIAIIDSTSNYTI